jgi:Flp pilus assembly protein TadD
VDWTLLGLCESALGNDAEAVKALSRAAEINPYRTDIHQQLARLYEKAGDTARATRHRQWAEALAAADRRRAGPRQ